MGRDGLAGLGPLRRRLCLRRRPQVTIVRLRGRVPTQPPTVRTVLVDVRLATGGCGVLGGWRCRVHRRADVVPLLGTRVPPLAPAVVVAFLGRLVGGSLLFLEALFLVLVNRLFKRPRCDRLTVL